MTSRITTGRGGRFSFCGPAAVFNVCKSPAFSDAGYSLHHVLVYWKYAAAGTFI